MNIVEKAKEFARRKHEGQTRRDGVTPYFNHLEAVASRVETDRLKTIAYLHDILEDTKVTYEDLIQEGFPREVVEAVVFLTHFRDENYVDYILRIKELECSSAKEIKIADILSNLADNPTKRQILKYAQALTILVS